MEREYLVKIKDLGQRYVKAENPKSALKKMCPLLTFVEVTDETLNSVFYRYVPINVVVQSTSSFYDNGVCKTWRFYSFPCNQKDASEVSFKFNERFTPLSLSMDKLEAVRDIMPLIHQRIKEVYSIELENLNMYLSPFVYTKEDAILYHKCLMYCEPSLSIGVPSGSSFFRKRGKIYNISNLCLSESNVAPIAQRLVNRNHIGICENCLAGIVVDEDNLEHIVMHNNLGINLEYTSSLWVNITVYYDLDKEVCTVVIDKDYLRSDIEYDDNPDDRIKLKQVQDFLKKPDKITISLSNCYTLSRL